MAHARYPDARVRQSPAVCLAGAVSNVGFVFRADLTGTKTQAGTTGSFVRGGPFRNPSSAFKGRAIRSCGVPAPDCWHRPRAARADAAKRNPIPPGGHKDSAVH